MRTALSAIFSRHRAVPGWAPNVVTAFLFLLFLRLGSAMVSGIEDCDETFNYWEPLHYLVFGYGFQTWEYSPQFALRSYVFLLPYSVVAKIGSMVSLGSKGPAEIKYNAFLAVRFAQAFACAAAETYLYDSVIWRFGKPAARLLLALLMAAPGLFRASVELLPSSFAMIGVCAATAAWLVGEFQLAVLGIAVAAVMGWPFAAVLGLPMSFHITYRKGILQFMQWMFSDGLVLAFTCFIVDTRFYGRFTLAPANLVIYNVLPAQGAGPTAFGVEDWKYYVFNMVLNLNVSALLLVLYPLLWIWDGLVADAWPTRQDALTRLIFLSPAFIWLFVMFNQPHKEERFLAPVYPLVALVSAVSLDDVLRIVFGLSRNLSESSRKYRVIVKNLFCLAVVCVAFALGASRMLAVIKGYSAPMKIYTHLSTLELQYGEGPRSKALPQDVYNICVGKEWYRFPSNFFLPSSQFRLRFIKSEFSGLLPKEFAESGRGTQRTPPGMNMYNEEDPAQYFNDTLACHYFVELDLEESVSGTTPTNPIPPEARAAIWEEDFLWSEKSRPFFRAFYVPGWEHQYWTLAKYRIYRNAHLLPFRRN
ncbi:Alpha-1,2-mannosyltransferase ALG9 [Porphyridium purpureum]|uniref:Mannosyltransferase n=1 Tax=Porphyridium purpureum TaxID=35688 RepID=A0A5J4Z452_PORPP|nr:Alpha-1,2-mannosyltransferase ALG9 [Porphyridium purpureum]|eukprot:POR4472..scf295_1